MDADFSTSLGETRASRQGNYRLTNPDNPEPGTSPNPVLTGFDNGNHATLGRTGLDQTEQPVQWSSPRRTTQDLDVTPRRAPLESESSFFRTDSEPATFRSVMDDHAPVRSVMDDPAPVRQVSEVDPLSLRAAHEATADPVSLRANREQATDPASLRATLENELASRRAAAEADAAARRAAEVSVPVSLPRHPEVDTAPRHPEVDTAPRHPEVDTALRHPEVDTALRHPEVDTSSISRRVSENGSGPRRAAAEPEPVPRLPAFDTESANRHASAEPEHTGRRAAREAENARLARESESAPVEPASAVPQRTDPRAAEFRAPDAPTIDLHHIMRLLVASHDLDLAAGRAESGEITVSELASIARRTRSAAVELVSAWYGGPDHMRRFGEVLLEAAAETA
ncbi:hypothetical protein [Nocardia jejuensis]|uniref:hypothetical protein n=1 Tax=Nocardia jejuensis TaxID=328049 RepID=UPI0012F814ED|nr:hypothetical protein [Nocardia jejuensis]